MVEKWWNVTKFVFALSTSSLQSQASFWKNFCSQEEASIQPRSSRKNAISAVGAKVAINCISMAQALGNRHEARTQQQYRTRRLHFASIGYFFNIHISIFSAFNFARVWFRQILIAFFACSDGVDGTRDD